MAAAVFLGGTQASKHLASVPAQKAGADVGHLRNWPVLAVDAGGKWSHHGGMEELFAESPVNAKYRIIN